MASTPGHIDEGQNLGQMSGGMQARTSRAPPNSSVPLVVSSSAGTHALGREHGGLNLVDYGADQFDSLNYNGGGYYGRVGEVLPSTEADVPKAEHKVSDAKRQAHEGVLYCLMTQEQKGGAWKQYYKDQPWKGVVDGLSNSELDKEVDQTTVITYCAYAVVENRAPRLGNTAQTWKENPVDFELGRDATVISYDWPSLILNSQNLVEVMKLLLDYYPGQLGRYDFFKSDQDNFVALMYYFDEMKEYLKTYQQSNPSGLLNLEIGDCGAEEIPKLLQGQLDLGELAQRRCDESTARDIAILLRLLAPMYRNKVAPIFPPLSSPEPLINYESLWYLFRPGTYIYVNHSAFLQDGLYDLQGPTGNNDRSGCVVVNWLYKPKQAGMNNTLQEGVHDCMEISAWSIAYTGTKFQRVAHTAIIQNFKGFKTVQSLPIIPALLQDQLDGGAFRNKLENMGRKYLSILAEPRKVAYREYDDPVRGYQGPIIVDSDAYNQQRTPVGYGQRAGYPGPQLIDDGGGGKKFADITNFDTHNSQDFQRIDEVYRLLPSQIGGLALKSKSWLVFDMDKISDGPPISPPNQLGSELVLVRDIDKEILRTVRPKGEQRVAMSSDFIAGKGEGQIFLLYGPPGTGKTLTVECVANDTGRPLLTLTAQDLGGTSFMGQPVNMGLHGNSETVLRTWFSLAAKWDAILLIDEADLFLEQRREGDLDRNSLSTVFLRTMEYYKGVLFLTTNRPGHLDDSFISRITCPIAYLPLSKETKANILDKLVHKFEETGTISVDTSATDYLIENCDNLNGREIRNILQNAVSSAEVSLHEPARKSHTMPQQRGKDMVRVKMIHVKAAVERQKAFQEYLKQVKGDKDELTRARRKQDYLVPP